MPTQSLRDRAPVVVPLLAAAAMVPLSLALPDGAAVLWIAALVLVAVGLTAAVRSRRKPLRGSRVLLIVTAFIVAAAVGAGTVLQSAGSVSTAGVPTGSS
ncbi:hypothetical protein [Cellulomonas sp.]|uniref:hypothetical protein n=1 Tax=Cellulomonas sp. TaxID=40001 RepID=UPI003BAB1EC8